MESGQFSRLDIILKKSPEVHPTRRTGHNKSKHTIARQSNKTKENRVPGHSHGLTV